MAPLVKCCRSTPRCRNCPARRPVGDPTTLTASAELAALLAPTGGDVPAHLVGLPRCLHKYEPLFRQAGAEAEASAEPSCRQAATDAAAPVRALRTEPEAGTVEPSFRRVARERAASAAS